MLALLVSRGTLFCLIKCIYGLLIPVPRGQVHQRGNNRRPYLDILGSTRNVPIVRLIKVHWATGLFRQLKHDPFEKS